MLSHRRLFSIPLGVIAATAAFLSLTASSQAALLTQSAVNCGNPATAQVFSPWTDFANYDLVPGGSFESGAASWSLSGGAATVAGNESFDVNSASDSQSLSLPSGSSATSPTFCVGVQNPTIRLFAENTGNPTSVLLVSANFVGPLGLPLSAPIGLVTADGTWQPTGVLPIVANLLTVLPGNQTPVSITTTPLGQGGDWQIDDVYVDPFGRT